MRGSATFLLTSLVSATAAWPGRVDRVTSLPDQTFVNAITRDAAGYLYIGGTVPAANPRSQADTDALVAKLSSDGARVLFWTVLSGSQVDYVTALALAPDGSILATGATASSDFPVTEDAAENQSNVSQGNVTGFFARFNKNGDVAYASYLNGSGTFLYPEAITTDASGAAYITGEGSFSSTPGALAAIDSQGVAYFVAKLDASGKQVYATGGIGGTQIALDGQGFIYIAGAASGQFALAVTPGSFQKTVKSSGCGGTPQLGFPCFHQYVAKLDPAASNLIYATWLSGSYGASPGGMSIDSEGNAILAGATESSDYPVTAGAFQETSFAALPPVDSTQTYPGISIPGPPSTGFVTKLNAAGSALVFSTFVGGSGQDTINASMLDGKGNIYLAGKAASPDFPGLSGVPEGCRPSYVYPATFLTRLSADGSALTATQLAFGLSNPLSLTRAFFDGQGNAVVALGNLLANLDLFAATPNFVCAADAADFAPLTAVVPGQLVSLFGNGMSSSEGVSFQPQGGRVPTSLGDGVNVTFNGVPAPILYSSADQVNVQVPYEVAGQSVAHLALTQTLTGAALGNRDFATSASAPGAFVSSLGYATCDRTITNSLLAVALNADGSRNGCGNPADAGSTVTLFVNALGLAGENPSTGAIAVAPATPLQIPVIVAGDAQVISAQSVPGSVNSVWAVRVRIAPEAVAFGTGRRLARFTLTIGGVPLRDQLLVWANAP
ncbi:MAG TPA: hypothetical protein VE263_07130 [Candidatus Angelobacter sp.]|nr:hypothetical protein [Candidatus Angelobacter sp.]